LIKTILGPPGCGKTQTNSNLIQSYIKEGIAPEQIACVSFTRKAAQESRERVSNDWGVPTDSLPYFQTLHSMAFRAGGYKPSDVIRGSDLKAIGDAVSVPFAFKRDSNVESDFDKLGASVGDTYLGLHHLSRSKCQSLEQTFREANNYNLHWPELKRLVDTYESYKKAHGKLDFTTWNRTKQT
jgi:superfamily I DNA/RNA helicase